MHRQITLGCIALIIRAYAHAAEIPDAHALARMSARFAPVDIRVDLQPLSHGERGVLTDLVRAARIMDAIYLRQVSPRNEALLMRLSSDSSELGRARLDYFLLNRGPWSRIDADAPFLPDESPKPDAANFYPVDADKKSLEEWFASLDGKQREIATGFYSTIRRDARGALISVPYSAEYQDQLQVAARRLRDAASQTSEPSLKRFLESRAQAFASNDYAPSDAAWMDLDAVIEPTIGPYEVYEDGLFNYKAAFEAFIALKDAKETAKLARFSGQLQGLENRLPIDAKFRRHLGAAAPIRVVNVLFAAGDGNRGVQTAAFNLPNDERVVAAKGSKRIMLKNFQEAKFTKVLQPIAARVLDTDDARSVSFTAFFDHILMHELMHGLGPQTLVVRGRSTTVRQELKELNGALEEAKADISGLWALQQLIDSGALPRSEERAIYVTFLASSFRTLRFGLTEAHAKGMALQLNTLLDADAVRLLDRGKLSVNLLKTKRAVTALTHQIMNIQATGDYAGAKLLSERMMVIRPQVERVIEELAELPVDIRPRFVTADSLDQWGGVSMISEVEANGQ